MKVLVIGGAGFVGRHLTKRLCALDEVTIFDREREPQVDERCTYVRGDISDYLSLERVFELTQPDLVFHLAGMVSRKECEETPLMAFQTNVMGAYNICELCIQFDARLIYAGSSEEYGQVFSSGDSVTESTRFGAATGIYSLTKRFADEIIQHFAAQKGLTATAVRLFMLYGPGEPANEYRSAVIRFIDYALRGEVLPVHADTSRSWCYIDDAVSALLLLSRRVQDEPYEALNIGKDDLIETSHLAKLIIKLTKSNSLIMYCQPDKTIIRHKAADFTTVKRLIGWEATTTLTKGLLRVIDYEKVKWE